MEAAGLALGVVAVFKDAYLTAKFIRNTVQSINDYHSEQSQLVTHYTVQIYRLKNLSRLFRAADGNTVDMKLLETVPEVCAHDRALLIASLALRLKGTGISDDSKRRSGATPTGFVKVCHSCCLPRRRL